MTDPETVRFAGSMVSWASLEPTSEFGVRNSRVFALSAGKVNAVPVTGPTRSPLVPNVPTAQESGLKGFDVTIWFGVLAPRGTPAPVLERLHPEIPPVMATDDMKKRMQADGAEARSTTPAEFAALIKSDTAKWAPVVKNSGASLE